jgi:hypothetical protein
MTAATVVSLAASASAWPSVPNSSKSLT